MTFNRTIYKFILPTCISCNFFQKFYTISDIISINIPEYRIELKVSDDELAARRAEMPIKKKENITGYLKRYAQTVSSADKGAIINYR